MPTVRMRDITNAQRQSLEKSLEDIWEREIGLRAMFDSSEIAKKAELDKFVFCDILGLSEHEAREAVSALATVVKNRIERPLLI